MRATRELGRLVALYAMTITVLFAVVGDVGAGGSSVRIDSGGSGAVETAGTTWDADTGYVGGRVVSGRVKDFDTSDVDIVRTQRVGMSAYRLPAPTAGTYRVSLTFAELENARPGRRVFDVVAEDAVVAPSVDVAAAVGKNRAYVVTFESIVKDGTLDLQFVPIVGEPAIAAIETELVDPQTASTSSGVTSEPTPTTAAPTTTTTAAPSTTTTAAPSTTTTTAPSTTTALPPTSVIEKLSWAPPALSNPTKIFVTNSSPYWLPTLDATRDYEIVLPGRPGNLQLTPLNHGIGVVGGRNVVIIGGEIRVPAKTVTPDPEYRVGIKLRQQRGTVHVEGVKILNATDVINLDQRYQAIVQLQNIFGESSEVDSDVFHSDNLQTWAGPAELRVDKWSGRSTFQGFFFNPDDKNFQNPAHPSPRLFDLRRVNIAHAGGAGYVYERIGSWPLVGGNLWGTHPDGKIVFTGYGPFPAVTTGTPTNGDFVPASWVGMGYVSPGYVP